MTHLGCVYKYVWCSNAWWFLARRFARVAEALGADVDESTWQQNILTSQES